MGALVIGAGLFSFAGPREVAVGKPIVGLQEKGSSTITTGQGTTSQTSTLSNGDIPNTSPLANPPASIKAIYLTGWSAGLSKKIEYVKKIASETEISAVVIDIKDYSGELSYTAEIPEVVDSKAGVSPKIKYPNRTIKELHDAGIYVIGRVSVFQDVVLAKAHPEWALKQGSTTATWKDRKGLTWMDASAKPVWDYNVAIAKDALARGFDEINFDYVRFPSDGNLKLIGYPYWDQKTARHTVIKEFFRYVRSQMPQARLSADLFGLATVNNDDLGIGQIIEDAYRYFDYVSPMVYPSHYAQGFLGFKNPAEYPYEVVYYSVEKAVGKLKALKAASMEPSSTVVLDRPLGKLRPWFQDFDLGATYDSTMIRKQINALNDVASGTPSLVDGWMIWSPSNNYRVGAYLKEQ